MELVVNLTRASLLQHFFRKIDANEMPFSCGGKCDAALACAAAEVKDVERRSGGVLHHNRGESGRNHITKACQPCIERSREVVEGRPHPATRCAVRNVS